MDYLSEPQGTWYCVAGSAHRSYKIEHLDRRSHQLQLTVYNSPQIDSQRLVEVVQIRVVENTSQGLLGNGTTQDGRTIQVNAFQQTVDFVVEEPMFGVASGVCSYLSDWE
ncbi:MAG: hypothetical protein NW224_23275 [Leptolyngbyaceae cyanobacterium bins.302]|nr:hypothetical protein [Leptolyngbyaceae cyanobacterium bins.302]